MATLLETKLRNYPMPYFTDWELGQLLDGTEHSRYGLLKRAVQKQELIRLRRGLYCWNPDTNPSFKPHPFELAQKIYSPSYISLESALSYHGLIPEAVHTITSVCTNRNKAFATPIGMFSYQRLPSHNFFLEVELVESNKNKFLLAKPWKAIGDYIFCYKKNWVGIKPLLQSLRIAEEDLPTITTADITLLIDFYHSSRVTKFFKSIQRDLNL